MQRLRGDDIQSLITLCVGELGLVNSQKIRLGDGPSFGDLLTVEAHG